MKDSLIVATVQEPYSKPCYECRFAINKGSTFKRCILISDNQEEFDKLNAEYHNDIGQIDICPIICVK